jgi:hypothetical protein
MAGLTQKRKRLFLGGMLLIIIIAGISWSYWRRVTFPDCLQPYAYETTFVHRQARWDKGYVEITTVYSVNEPPETLVVALYKALGKAPCQFQSSIEHRSSDEWSIRAGKAWIGEEPFAETRPMERPPDWSMVYLVKTRPTTFCENILTGCHLPWIGWHYNTGMDYMTLENMDAEERLYNAIQKLPH